MNKLQETYQQQIVPDLQSSLGLSNPHQVPRIEKVVVNVGVGRAASDKRLLEVATNTLRKITGQQPVTTKARKSVAGFKLREGQEIGVKVTLRGAQMYDFLERLLHIVLPRTRDFHGLSAQAFDPQGNYSLGVNDQSAFPELSYEDMATPHGLQINIITNSTPEQSKQLLESFGFLFEGKGGGNG